VLTQANSVVDSVGFGKIDKVQSGSESTDKRLHTSRRKTWDGTAHLRTI